MEQLTDLNQAYKEFDKVLDAYKDATADYMRDCVYITHSRGENGVNGLRKQGFNLDFITLSCDTLHLGYRKKSDGDGQVEKYVNMFFKPYCDEIFVVLHGFDSNDPHMTSDYKFKVSDGADAFADFIEGLPSYKGESKMKESKLKIKVRESKKSEKTTHIIGEDDFITWLYAGDMAARDDIERDSDEGFVPEVMDTAVERLLPKLFEMYESFATIKELSEVLQEAYYQG